MKGTITGHVTHVGQTRQITDTFKVRKFILEVADGNYTQTVALQCTQDKTLLLDTIKVGQEVWASYNIRGKAYTNKDGEPDAFVSLDAWKIETKAPVVEASKQDFEDVPF